MSDLENKPAAGFMPAFKNSAKWYVLGCFISFAAFYLMTALKLDIRTIETVFQIGCGICFGAMLQMRSRQNIK